MQSEAIFDQLNMFCRNYGKGLESSFAFCPNCGAKVEAETSSSSRDNIVGSASLTSRKRASPSEPAAPATKQFPTFRQFVDRKTEERRGHFKQMKKVKLASCKATINVALMEYEGDELKPVRGSSLPLKVEVSSNYNEVKDAAIKKRKDFDRTFNAERGNVLAYQDARIAKQIPGSDQDFLLKSYKEWLGKSYSRLTLYLSPISKLEEVLDLDGGISQESVFDEWSDCDVTLRAFDKIEDLEFKTALERVKEDYEKEMKLAKSALSNFAEKYVIDGKPGLIPEEFFGEKKELLEQFFKITEMLK